MVYTNVFDLVKALAVADPDLTIVADAGELPYGYAVKIVSKLMPESSELRGAIEDEVSSAALGNLTAIIPPFATGGFRLQDFRVVDERVHAEIRWEIDHGNSIESYGGDFSYDVLMGEEDVWGSGLVVEGIEDFDEIREGLNAWGMAEFDIEIEGTRWVKEDVALVEANFEEVDEATRILIEQNLPALSAALKERYKKLALGIKDHLGASSLNWSSAYASDPGITITDGFSGAVIESCSLRDLFDYNCEIEIDL